MVMPPSWSNRPSPYLVQLISRPSSFVPLFLPLSSYKFSNVAASLSALAIKFFPPCTARGNTISDFTVRADRLRSVSGILPLNECLTDAPCFRDVLSQRSHYSESRNLNWIQTCVLVYTTTVSNSDVDDDAQKRRLAGKTVAILSFSPWVSTLAARRVQSSVHRERVTFAASVASSNIFFSHVVSSLFPDISSLSYF